MSWTHWLQRIILLMSTGIRLTLLDAIPFFQGLSRHYCSLYIPTLTSAHDTVLWVCGGGMSFIDSAHGTPADNLGRKTISQLLVWFKEPFFQGHFLPLILLSTVKTSFIWLSLSVISFYRVKFHLWTLLRKDEAILYPGLLNMQGVLSMSAGSHCIMFY